VQGELVNSQRPGPATSDHPSGAHRVSGVKALGAVLAVGLVPLALVVAPLARPAAEKAAVQTVVAGAVAPAPPQWLAVRTGATSSITLNTAAGPQGAAQTLAPAASCGVNLGPATAQLLNLRGSTGGALDPLLASYASGSIGVKEKKTGTSCYQVSAPSESLELGLGAGLRTALNSDVIATSAYLDVELKGSARILATARQGTTVVGTFELQSGNSVGLSPPLATTAPFVCTGRADSGPDSGPSDNCRWPISAPSWLGADDGINFDTLTLKAVVGSFSVEGGADGSIQPPAGLSTDTAAASIIELATAVGCGGTTGTTIADGAKPAVTIHRLDNVGPTPCSAVPYKLTTADNSARFLKPLDVQPTAQFVWDVTSLFPSTTATTVLPDIKIDYETPDATGASPLVKLGWCPDANAVDDPALFPGYTVAQVAALPDQDDFIGTQFACVISRTAKAVAGDPDQVSVRDLVYVYGDARMQF
jgi:hypothetical protein